MFAPLSCRRSARRRTACYCSARTNFKGDPIASRAWHEECALIGTRSLLKLVLVFQYAPDSEHPARCKTSFTLRHKIKAV